MARSEFEAPLRFVPRAIVHDQTSANAGAALRYSTTRECGREAFLSLYAGMITEIDLQSRIIP
jgi:hypothetical protein